MGRIRISDEKVSILQFLMSLQRKKQVKLQGQYKFRTVVSEVSSFVGNPVPICLIKQ